MGIYKMSIYKTMLMQAARDGLARLHGEPQHAKKVKPEPDAGGDNLHTHGQEQVLDSLVSLLAGLALPPLQLCMPTNYAPATEVPECLEGTSVRLCQRAHEHLAA